VAFADFCWREVGLKALSLLPFGRYGFFSLSLGRGSTIDFTNS
jgi:hypothetical protein